MEASSSWTNNNETPNVISNGHDDDGNGGTDDDAASVPKELIQQQPQVAAKNSADSINIISDHRHSPSPALAVRNDDNGEAASHHHPPSPPPIRNKDGGDHRTSPPAAVDNADVDSPDYLLPSNLHNPPLYGTVSYWAEFTSIHGMYYMFERGHLTKWKQYLWSFICLFFLIGLLWTLQEELKQFKQFRKSSEHKTIIPQSLSFPQVTICNTNRWDVSRQNNATDGILEPANEADVFRISQPLEEFIMGTSFNGISFDHANIADLWTRVITPLGLCYTFTTDERIFVPGPAAGLDIAAWLNQTNYEDTTAVAGVVVYVTQTGTTVTSQTPMVVVPPGSASFLSVGLFQFQREEREPWRNCNGYTPEYSNELCRSNCFERATRDECNCRLLGDDTKTTTVMMNGTTTTIPLRYCNSTDTACTRSVLENDDDIDILASYPECQSCSIPPCREEAYITMYSSARIATKFADNLEMLQGLDPGEIAQNFVYVNINYDSIRYEERTETRSTDFAQLWSNLGGSMGFFMGISMISIVEFFGELLALRLMPRLWSDRRLFGVGQKED